MIAVRLGIAVLLLFFLLTWVLQIYIVRQHTTAQPEVVARFEQATLTNVQDLAIELGAVGASHILNIVTILAGTDLDMAACNDQRSFLFTFQIYVGGESHGPIAAPHDYLSKRGQWISSAGKGAAQISFQWLIPHHLHLRRRPIVESVIPKQNPIPWLEHYLLAYLEPLHVDHGAIGAAHILNQMMPLMGKNPSMASGNGTLPPVVVAQIDIGVCRRGRIKTA
jgi:hypothetical protein